MLRHVSTLHVPSAEGAYWEVFCSDLFVGDLAYERCDTEARARAVHREFAREYA